LRYIIVLKRDFVIPLSSHAEILTFYW